MASSVWVVDSSFKRTQVKVTPGKYLREVLEEACESRKLTPELYALKTQTNKILDLSQPFRLSGLSAGAKLQLVQASRSPSVVSLALQLPESEGGGRLSDKFPSTTSLWLCLRKFEDGVAGSSRKLNLTQRGAPSGTAGSGRLLYEQPCVNVMGRSLETFQDLQKTLAQIGLNSGTALIRLTFKMTDKPLEEAMHEISQHFAAELKLEDSSAAAASGAHAAPDGQARSVPDAGAPNAGVPLEGDAGTEPNEDVPAQDGPTAPIVENDVIASSTVTEPQPIDQAVDQPDAVPESVNGIFVYKAPSSSTPAAAAKPDDPTEFEPTVDHAKAHQAALQRAGKNTRLLSDKELEEAEQQKRQKLAAVQSAKLRVRYPDQHMVELVVDTSETGAGLYEKITNTLVHPEPFELRFMSNQGHKVIPDLASSRLIRDLGMQGNQLINLAWKPEASLKARQGPILKDEYLTRATELKVDIASQHSQGQAAHQAAMEAKPAAEEKKGANNKGNLEAKLKKLVGFGKK